MPFKVELADSNGVLIDPPVFEAGKEYSFMLDYNLSLLGEMERVAKITLPDWISLDVDGIDLKKNPGIEKIELDGDGNLVVTIADPSKIDQNSFAGVFQLKFQVDLVQNSEYDEITWEHDGNGEVFEVVVKKQGEENPPAKDFFSKKLDQLDLSGLLTVKPEGGPDNFVTISDTNLETLLGKKFNFKLVTESAEGFAVGYTITDVLGDFLMFSGDGVTSAKSEIWDDKGLNKKANESYGNFDHSVTGSSLTIDITSAIETAARLTFEVQAQIDPAPEKITALLLELNRQYALSNPMDGGAYKVNLKNDAFFNGTGGSNKAFDSVDFGGDRPKAPGVVVGNIFGKTNDFTNPTVVEVDEDLSGTEKTRTLTDAEDVLYSLKVDLSGLKHTTNDKQKLKSDVIVTDLLPDGLTWVQTPALKESVGGVLSTSSDSLRVGPQTGALSEFEYRFKGQSFEVNLGRNNYKYYIVEVPATIESLTHRTNPTSNICEAYRETNKATIAFETVYNSETHTDTKTSDVELEVNLPKKGTDPIEESSAFSKAGPAKAVSVDPGDPAEIRFDFTGNRVNLAKSTITDFVDNKIFGTTGQYLQTFRIGGTVNDVKVNEDHFTIVGLPDGNFTIRVKGDEATNETDEEIKKFLKLDGSDKFALQIFLTTLPIKGSGSLWVSNTAQLTGGFGEHTVTSSTSAVGTTRGNEIEVRKTVWDDKTDSWQSNIKAPLTEEGSALTDNTFVYRIQFFAHGLMGDRYFAALNDLLPAGTEFVGFVENVDSSGTLGQSIKVDGQKLTATYSDGKIEMNAPKGITGGT